MLTLATLVLATAVLAVPQAVTPPPSPAPSSGTTTSTITTRRIPWQLPPKRGPPGERIYWEGYINGVLDIEKPIQRGARAVQADDSTQAWQYFVNQAGPIWVAETNGKYCLDAGPWDFKTQSVPNGAKVGIWECNAKDRAQQWWIRYDNRIMLVGPGDHCVRPIETGKVLDLPDGQRGAQLQVWQNYAGNFNQEWMLWRSGLDRHRVWPVDNTTGNVVLPDWAWNNGYMDDIGS